MNPWRPGPPGRGAVVYRKSMPSHRRSRDPKNQTLTAVEGLQVGHVTDTRGLTGCTVVLCGRGAEASVDQRGGAPGTRETDLLRPSRLVRQVHAVLLTGGSAFGLAAAQGVVDWLEERGLGFPTNAGPVPIVPAAVLYDLEVGDSKARPDARMGREACENATRDPVAQGSVGAGTGCRVGALFGGGRAMKGGLGSSALSLPGSRGRSAGVVAALFAVNALGDIVDRGGKILAGLRAGPRSRRFSGTFDSLAAGLARPGRGLGNTVIGVVATDARLDREALAHVASMAHDGIARAVRPSHTLHDGDTIFALSTGKRAQADPSLVGALAAEATLQAIQNAVIKARSLGKLCSMTGR